MMSSRLIFLVLVRRPAEADHYNDRARSLGNLCLDQVGPLSQPSPAVLPKLGNLLFQVLGRHVEKAGLVELHCVFWVTL